jgi:hypothetical protein
LHSPPRHAAPAALVIALALAFLTMPPVAAQQSGCTATLRPGDDVRAAVAAARMGGVVCLAAGEHAPFAVTDVAAGVTVRGQGGGATVIAGEDEGPAVRIDGVERFTLADLVVRGGVVVAGSRAVTLRDLRVEDAETGLLVEDASTAQLDGVQVERTDLAGVAVRDGVVTASRLTVRDPGAYGVVALGAGASVTLRESTVDGGATAALFVGLLGCAEWPVATATVPLCFYDDLDAVIGEASLSVSGSTIEPGAGTGVLAFPGTSATLEMSTVRGRGRGGLRAWGARLTVRNATLEDNAVAGIESWSYPDPRGEALLRGRLEVQRTTVRGTQPLGGPILGDGIVVRGGDYSIRTVVVEANRGAGLVIGDGAAGDLRDSDVRDNAGPGLCLGAGVLMTEGGNLVAGNARTSAACGEGAMLE